MVSEKGLTVYVVASMHEIDRGREPRFRGTLKEAFKSARWSNGKLDELIESGHCQVISKDQYDDMRYRVFKGKVEIRGEITETDYSEEHF